MKKYIMDEEYGKTNIYTITEVIPEGYFIWNIGRAHFPHECYIPLCREKEGQPYHVESDTLLAFKVKDETLALDLLAKAGRKTIDREAIYKAIKQHA